ncbi:Uu.00g058810.m01.CDS01 [Anthostomella pinea]|uniref:Uu.00g058810.m01.CDS01 n=1 Tax=Anthostomella pinea TaxID=933095 RepID=A0AAI8VS01_9PEZI|nr:Uu.00g058810.m01.CDS01 [Anthostomella pinea]
MPRPRRTRAAPARAAKATNPTPAPVPAPAHKQPAREPSSDIYDVSDREKERAAARRQSVELGSARRRRSASSVNSQQAYAIEKARQRRDTAMDRLENVTSTEDSAAAEDSADKSDNSIEVGRRATATPPQGRLTSMSGLDLDDEMFDDLNTTYDTAGPASAHRSVDTSTLSVTHFRRRPRAGSFLSRDEGPIRPPSRTGPNTPGLSSTFNIGVFKRRAREPSILGTAQKPRPQRPEPEHESELEQEEEEEEEEELTGEGEENEAIDEDAFAPEAESTPFRRSKRRSGEAEAATSSSANSKKRKSTEGHERRLRSSPYEIDDPIRESVEQEDTSDIGIRDSVEQEDAGEIESPQPSLPRELDRPSTPIMDEELMAPPLSSGSSGDEPEIWPPLQALAKGRTRRAVSALRRTPVPNDNVSDMSSPPSLTYSPNYAEPSPPPARAAKPKRKAATKPEPKVTTADLKGMLPRRRQRNARADPFGIDDDSEAEVDISGLGNDDDELSHLDVRARRRPARAAANNQSTTRGRSATRDKGKQTSGSTNKPARRTYGRSSDKENHDNADEEEVEEEDDDTLGPAGEAEEGVEESSQEMLARMGDELKNASRKFKEVDKWELEYEEMTQSSSPGAR